MRHGHYVTYVRLKCRCEPCKVAHNAYLKAYRLDRHRGVQRLLDPAPLHKHVEQLRAAGMSDRAITLAAGWKSRNSLYLALDGRRVTRKTMQRVLAVTTATDQRGDRYVDATGSRRRLQALGAIGWPYRVTADATGMDQSGINLIRNGQTRTIRYRTAQAISRLYDELWDQPGPSVRTRSIAAKNGWLPPLAWDDDTIDEPDAQPQLVNDKRDRNGFRASQYLLEDWVDTWDHHQGDLTIAAARLGMTCDSLRKALLRLARDGHHVPRAQVTA